MDCIWCTNGYIECCARHRNIPCDRCDKGQEVERKEKEEMRRRAFARLSLLVEFFGVDK